MYIIKIMDVKLLNKVKFLVNYYIIIITLFSPCDKLENKLKIK
jgi:hypothetical protein